MRSPIVRKLVLRAVPAAACVILSICSSASIVHADWTRAPLSFVVLRDDAPEGMRGFVTALEAAGGHAAVVYPPSCAVVLAEPAVLETPALRARMALSDRGRIAIPAKLARDSRTRSAAAIWNASLELEAAAALERATGSSTADGPHAADAGPQPFARPWRGDPPRAQVSDHMPYGAQYYDTSAYMAGSAAVGVWLLDAAPPSPYVWSDAHETQTLAGVQSGLANWVRKGGAPTFLTFYLDIHHHVQVSGTPIENSMSMDQTWVNEALGNAGWTGSDGFEKCFQYNNSIRDANNTNWCYSIFIVESDPTINQGLFNGGGYAWAYYGGPWVYMARYSSWAYGSSTYYAGVPMHESGHIFYDTDEYDGSLQYNGYLDAPDDPNYPPCIMNRNDTTRVCPTTRVQLGWRDTDANGIIEPLDSPPAVTLTPFTPDPTSNHSPTYSGMAQVTTVQNLCPYYRYFPLHNITLATIDQVQCRVDGGAWSAAVAGDGAFDGYTEGFTWTPTPPLAPGGHLIESRAHTSVGKWNAAYASDSVYVTAPLSAGEDEAGAFSMLAPRPNPARAAAEFGFILPQRCIVDAEVLDLAGRRVCSLATRESFGGGAGTLHWDGRDARGVAVAAGVYLARIRAGSETAMRRIVIAP